MSVKSIEAIRISAQEHCDLGIAMTPGCSGVIAKWAANAQVPFRELALSCPMPFVLYQDNSHGVRVNDCEGYTIYEVTYDELPDEMKSHMREHIITQSRAVAHFLVTCSNGGVA